MKQLAILAIFLFATLVFADSNRCFEDWMCTTQQEWEAGWYAHPDNGASDFPEHLAPLRQDHGGDRLNEPNACHWSGWTCTSNDDWVRGWYAANEPDLPGCVKVDKNGMLAKGEMGTMHDDWNGKEIEYYDPGDEMGNPTGKLCPRYV